MRIAVAFIGRRGGGERYTLELARALAQTSGIETCLLLARDVSLRGEFEQLDLSELALRTYRNAAGFVVASTTRGWREYRRVRDWLSRERIDVLIMGMIHPWSPWIVRAARSAGVPVITVVHEPGPHPGDPVALATLMRWCIDDCVSQSNAIVALTRATAQRVAARAAVTPCVIAHGVFAYHVQQQPRELDVTRRVHLLFFGRIAPHKGLGQLLAAFERLQRERSDIDLEICGEGDLSGHTAALSRLANVHVANRWVADQEIGAIFRRCDVCVLPYLQASQSGVVGIAQAAGVPIVAFPEPGIVEQLAAGGGLVTPTATVDALVDALRRVTGDAALYRSLSDGAIGAARAANWPAIAARFVEVAATLARSCAGAAGQRR